MIGDMPPTPPLLGWRWPRGPFIIPVRISASPIFASFGVCLELALVVRNEDEPHSSAAILSACAVSAAGTRYDQRLGGGAFGSAGTPGSRTTRWTTSLFQMNNTISAPSVAVMRPAP